MHAARVSLIALLSGCATLADMSAGHVGCAASDITTSDMHWTLQTRSWIATCHGQRYHCATFDTRSSSQIACAPEEGDALATTAPAREPPAAATPVAETPAAETPPSPPTRAPDPPGTWRASVIETGLARVRTPVLRCIASSHLPADVGARVDEEGRITETRFAATLGEAERQCTQRALSTLDLNGRVEQPREVTITVAAGGFTVVGGEEAAPIASAGGESAPATDAATTLRAAVDAHAETILACTDGASVAISATWSDAGDVTFALRGRAAGSDVEQCVQSALGTMHVAPGTAGSILYPVAPR